MGNAGRVLMIPKGDYNAATTYEMLDFVYYQGRSYVCKQTSTGNAPTNTTYWQALTGDASAEIQALTNYVANNNVKNFLPVTAQTQTKNGLTFTVNNDGSVTVTGTASAQTDFAIGSVTLKDGQGYVLSGCPSGGSTTTYRLNLRDYGSDIGSGYEVTAVSTTLSTDVYIRFNSGFAISGSLVFKPMITDANIPDSDYAHYQPYAKTNVELTQDVSDVLPIVGDAIEITTTESFANLKNGITYKFSTSDTGNPFSGYNVAVKVAKVASTSGVQIAYKVVSSANTELDLLAIRPCLGGTYGAWRKFSGVIPA